MSVSPKYTNELAVLSAWVAMLLPWSVSTHGEPYEFAGESPESSILFVRLPLVELQFRSPVTFEQFRVSPTPAELLDESYPGIELVADVFVADPGSATLAYDGMLQWASLVWGLGALAFLAALVFSVVLYLRELRVTAALPVGPARLMGLLLGTGTLAVTIASVLLFLERGSVGTPVPVGVPVTAALAVVLLRSDTPDLDALAEKREQADLTDDDSQADGQGSAGDDG